MEDTNKLIQVGSLDYPLRKEMVRRVYSTNGISPTLTSNNAGGNIPPKIIVLGKLSLCPAKTNGTECMIRTVFLQH